MWDTQKRELEMEQICEEIFEVSRTELYIQMRFLNQALSMLGHVKDISLQRPLATDGSFLYYQPERVIEQFRKNNIQMTRSCLHVLLHCLFWHPYPEQGRDEEYWDLACDVAVEHIIDHLYVPCVHIPRSAVRREAYGWLSKEMKTVTAERVYRFLQTAHFHSGKLSEWEREFACDSHKKWHEEQDKKPNMQTQKKKWEDLRHKMQTEMEMFSKEASQQAGSILENLRIQNRRKQDYREFLRKFAILKEEMKVDMDSFDYIFYNYGMELYGNMPLIEPLETKEERRIEDFILVIDTSMSCQIALVKKFLAETYTILTQEESYTRRIHIRVIQCDEKVQADVKLTSAEDLKQYMENFTLYGGGGTDFRPAFAYVEELLIKKQFHHLRGLLYFTDGKGIYPAKTPLYQTAFVFMEEDYCDVDVPPWAMKLIVCEEELEGEIYSYDDN